MKQKIIIVIAGIAVNLIIATSIVNGWDDNRDKGMHTEGHLSNWMAQRTSSTVAHPSISDISSLKREYDIYTKASREIRTQLQGLEQNLQQYQGIKSQGKFWAGAYYVPKIVLDGASAIPGPAGLVASGISNSLSIHEDLSSRGRITQSTAGLIGVDIASKGIENFGGNRTANAYSRLATGWDGYSLSSGGVYVRNDVVSDELIRYSRIQSAGKKLGLVGNVISVISDSVKGIRGINEFDKIEKNMKQNIAHTEKLRQEMDYKRLTPLIRAGNLRDTDYISRYGQGATSMEKMLEFHQPLGGNKLWHDMPATEQFRIFSNIAPYSQESIFYGQTKSISALTNNITLSTKAVNFYIGGATSRNEVISRTLDAYELGYRPVDGYGKSWAYPGSNFSHTLGNSFTSTSSGKMQTGTIGMGGLNSQGSNFGNKYNYNWNNDW